MNSAIASYVAKNDYLAASYSQVAPLAFYRSIFPTGALERAGNYNDHKPNGIVTIIQRETAKNRLFFDELSDIPEYLSKDFVVTSPVAYFGRNRTQRNASLLFGFCIDLDGVEMKQLQDLLYEMENKIIPTATYIVNSGHGLHLYYILDEPLNLYTHLHEPLRELKYALIDLVWNRYTSTIPIENRQYLGIFQGFRMVGSPTKLGRDYILKAYRTGDTVSIEYLNQFVAPDKRLENYDYQSNLTLDQAKLKYPAWYERRIEQKQPRSRWVVKPDLYFWWLNKIKEQATVGHRYNTLCVLFAYAQKCMIDEDQALSDALSLVDKFDAMSLDESNRFTQKDVYDSLKFYQESYVHFSRSEAERISGISIPPNKRNGRKQKVHLQIARATRDIVHPEGWQNKEGRPTKQAIVEQWQLANPNGSKTACIKETGLSKPTVYKWWIDKNALN